MSHTNVECRKCGTKGWSKCPHCRNVFVDHDDKDAEKASGMQSFMTATRGSWKDKSFVKDDGNDLVVTTYWHTGSTISDELKSLRDILSACSDECLEKFCCCHDWQFVAGQKSTIDCGHGSNE